MNGETGKMKTTKLFALLLLAAIPMQAQTTTASDVEVGPWITNVSDDSATILWTTANPGRAWVELEDGTKIWETFAGRRIFGRFHTVTVKGLEPGQLVRYRVGGELLASDKNPMDPSFGESFLDNWHQFKTFNPSAQTCRFTMFNDIHLKVDKFKRMAACIDSASTDFIFYDGDIVSAGNYNLDTLASYSIKPLGSLANGLPLMFARGNHEGRGNNTPLVKAIYPNDGPAFYHFFRVGPIAFIVFDQGETHTDRSSSYCGTEVFEAYLNEQLEWAREVVKDPAFSSAPVQVCFIHAGMFDDPNKNSYVLQRWMNKNIVPFLNEAGIDLMLSADLHTFRLDRPGQCGNDFPILTNDDAERLEFNYADGLVSIETFNSNGERTHTFSLKIDK